MLLCTRRQLPVAGAVGSELAMELSQEEKVVIDRMYTTCYDLVGTNILNG